MANFQDKEKFGGLSNLHFHLTIFHTKLLKGIESQFKLLSFTLKSQYPTIQCVGGLIIRVQSAYSSLN